MQVPPFQVTIVPLTTQVALELEKQSANFEYVKTKYGGVVDQYKKGLLPNRHLLLVLSGNQVLGYTLYTNFTNAEANAYIRGEGDTESTLSSNYRGVLFIDNMEVANQYKGNGFGTHMYSLLRGSSPLPFFLQSTEDSENFWFNLNFKPIDGHCSWLIDR